MPGAGEIKGDESKLKTPQFFLQETMGWDFGAGNFSSQI